MGPLVPLAIVAISALFGVGCSSNKSNSNSAKSPNSDKNVSCNLRDTGSYSSNPTVCSFMPSICDTPKKEGADNSDPVDVCSQETKDFPTALAKLYSLIKGQPVSPQNSAIKEIGNSGRVTITEFSNVGMGRGSDRAHLELPVSVYQDILRQSGRLGEVPTHAEEYEDCIYNYPALTFLNVAQYVRSLQIAVCAEPQPISG